MMLIPYSGLLLLKSSLFNIGFVIWGPVKSAANYGVISTVTEP